MPMKIDLNVPHELDGRPVFVNSPGLEGSFTFITGKGDDLTPEGNSGRGEGVSLFVTFSEPGSSYVETPLLGAIELFRGQVFWRPTDAWDFEDTWSLCLKLPATEVVANQNNTGNCNIIETVPESGMYIVVPSGGDGGYDVDYETAVPCPDGYTEKNPHNTGYWNVDKYWSEDLTPSGDGFGEFNLYTFSIKFYFCKNITCGNPNGSWSFPGQKAEWISSRWLMRLEANKVTSGAGKIGGILETFRNACEEI